MLCFQLGPLIPLRILKCVSAIYLQALDFLSSLLITISITGDGCAEQILAARMPSQEFLRPPPPWREVFRPSGSQLHTRYLLLLLLLLLNPFKFQEISWKFESSPPHLISARSFRGKFSPSPVFVFMLCLLESCALFAVWFTNDTAMIFSVAVHAGDRLSSTCREVCCEEVNSSSPQSFSA